jgi:hypothetical protein
MPAAAPESVCDAHKLITHTLIDANGTGWPAYILAICAAAAPAVSHLYLLLDGY